VEIGSCCLGTINWVFKAIENFAYESLIFLFFLLFYFDEATYLSTVLCLLFKPLLQKSRILLIFLSFLGSQFFEFILANFFSIFRFPKLMNPVDFLLIQGFAILIQALLPCLNFTYLCLYVCVQTHREHYTTS
jgi:hypothetical protein